MDKTGYRLDVSLALGSVEVTVADLDRTAGYYAGAIGLQVLDRDATHVRLGVPGRTLITVRELPGAVPPPLGEPGADRPFDGLPATTEPAHVQLKVTDAKLAATEPFYRDLLGFEIEHRMDGVFLGFGVAGYRSLVVVTNRFSPDGGEPAPEHSARLLGVELLLPQARDVHALAAHLTAAGYPHHLAADVLIVHDPSGNVLRFIAGTA